MDLAPIVTRLQSVTDFANRVFPARDQETAMDYVKNRTPAGTASCIVFAPRDKAEPSELLTGGVRQRVTASFSALVSVRYAGNAEAAYERLDTLRQAVQVKLLAWSPAAGYRGLHLVGGSLVYSEIGVVIWGDEFQTRYYVSSI